jgi:hypothetical protein
MQNVQSQPERFALQLPLRSQIATYLRPSRLLIVNDVPQDSCISHTLDSI